MKCHSPTGNCIDQYCVLGKCVYEKIECCGHVHQCDVGGFCVGCPDMRAKKMSTEEFWAGEFGDEYTKRNRVDWRARIPFWKEVIDITGARSVLEFGCNAGWNLSAIRRAYQDVALHGTEINESAFEQAWSAGLRADSEICRKAELVFTAGVLIHIAPEQLQETMQKLIDTSYDYVLAVEYGEAKEVEVEYRGHAGKLWKRPYGKLYEDLGLKCVTTWINPDGFDDCTAWLMRKP